MMRNEPTGHHGAAPPGRAPVIGAAPARIVIAHPGDACGTRPKPFAILDGGIARNHTTQSKDRTC